MIRGHSFILEVFFGVVYLIGLGRFINLSGDCRLQEPNASSKSDLDLEGFLILVGHFAEESADSYYVVTHPDALDERAMLLHPLLLWPDEEEVEDHAHHEQRHDRAAEETAWGARARSGSSGGVGEEREIE